jgi:hypothetical protein
LCLSSIEAVLTVSLHIFIHSVAGNQSRDAAMFDGEQSKILEGWGGTRLPDPPVQLLRAADPARDFQPARNDLAWQSDPACKTVPKYSVFLGLEFDFLLRDRDISKGMLALFHGHTFKVQGVEEPVMTYTVAAGVSMFST